MNVHLRNTAAATLICAGVFAGVLAGCGQRRPVTILFTGDEQGRLVPAG